MAYLLSILLALLRALPVISDAVKAWEKAQAEKKADQERADKDARNQAALDAALKDAAPPAPTAPPKT